MAADAWTFTFVFQLPEGGFCEETLRYTGELAAAAAFARRDARALELGRTFMGFSAVSPAPDTTPLLRRPLVRRDGDSSRPLPLLLEPYGAKDDGRDAPEPPRHPVNLPGLLQVRWWELEDALGSAAPLALALGRCAATEPGVAARAAEEVSERIALNKSLCDATPVALPFVVELLSHPEVTCRPTLAHLVGTVARSAREANDTMSNLLARTARLVARDMAEAMATHQRSARASAEVLSRLEPKLGALATDPVVGETVRELIEHL